MNGAARYQQRCRDRRDRVIDQQRVGPEAGEDTNHETNEDSNHETHQKTRSACL